MTEPTKLPAFTMPIIANNASIAYGEIARIGNMIADKGLTGTIISQINSTLWVVTYHSAEDLISDFDHRVYIKNINRKNEVTSLSSLSSPSEDQQGEATP